jgi:hypothetical protein
MIVRDQIATYWHRKSTKKLKDIRKQDEKSNKEAD